MTDEREPELEPEEIQEDQQDHEAPEPQELSPEALASLVTLLKAMYPNATFPEDVYERCAEQVQEQSQVDLNAGLGDLKPILEQAASDEDRIQKVTALGEDDFLLGVHAVAVNTLYDDHEVWKILGYQGPSFEKGGYINRGFNDLDWLPEPRITEYEGEPRVGVVTLAASPASNADHPAREGA